MPYELCCSFVNWSLNCDRAPCAAWICVLCCVLVEEPSRSRPGSSLNCMFNAVLNSTTCWGCSRRVSQRIPRILNSISKPIISWEKMHGLNYIASCCVDYEYRCSIFLFRLPAWPTSTRPFLHCNVLLVFLPFSPSLDSGLSHCKTNWKKAMAWNGKCAMFLFRVSIKK